MLMTLLSLRTITIGCLLTLMTVATALAIPPRQPTSSPYFTARANPMPALIGDRIVGRWYFPTRESDIEIYRANGRYFAKIVAVSQATADKFGDMANKMLLTDLTFDKNEWAGGQLIHPQTGHRFDVFLTLTGPNTLVITAYKGCRLFNKAYTLTRI